MREVTPKLSTVPRASNFEILRTASSPMASIHMPPEILQQISKVNLQLKLIFNYMVLKLSAGSTGNSGNTAEMKHPTSQGQKSFPLYFSGQEVAGQLSPMATKPTLQTARLVYPNFR